MTLFIIVAVLTSVMLGGCESNAKQRSQEAINDASISAAVQAKLTGDRGSNFTRVSVDSDHGIVHLSGVVSSAEQRKRADELSRQVEGVSRVDNSLLIQRETNMGKLSE